MKHFAIIWIVIIIAALIAWQMLITPATKPIFITDTPTITPESIATKPSQYAIFVPYWSLSTSEKIDDKYSTVVYFGIAANSSGIDMTDDGYKDIKAFSSLVDPKQNKLLTVRMLDNAENDKILSNSKSQEKIISQAINVAKQNGFSGLVLDLELQSLPFNSVVEQIDGLFDKFSQQSKQANLTFDATMYGDLFYRPRPFDMTYLAKDIGHLYIMAYDLHKAGGQPGPNFPMKSVDNDNVDYNLGKMSIDYKLTIPVQKIIVVFGMFGYDWTIDDKGQTVGSGEALSDLQIQQLLKNCPSNSCTNKYDNLSGETVIHYNDNKNQAHIVWFEDINSTERKILFLRQQGIYNFGYWAYSYF